MELRPYQVEAVNAVFKSFWGFRRVLMVLPTGCGKTVVFAEIARRVMERHGNKVLILAHREELLDQAREKIWKVAGITADVERAGLHASASSSVVVASVQTLGRDARLNEYAPNHFALIIIDEAHHAPTAGYRRILDYFNAKVLGVTATPDRADKKKLSTVFDTVAYEYSILDAVRDRYLVPPMAQMMPVQIDLSHAHVRNGDYDAAEAAAALEPVLGKVADEMAKACASRRTVVFLPLVRISQAFAQMLRDRGLSAAEINGESADRTQVLADFSAGKYQVLCNSMLLTEGWDCPAVDCIVVLRPTQSRALYVQMVGRGMRLSPETGKKDLLILDFLWLTGRHLLCRPSALFAKTEEEAKAADKRLEVAGQAVDIMEVGQQAERDVLKERAAALVRAAAAQCHKKARLVNPLIFASEIAELGLADYEPVFEWQKAPPSEKQLDAIERFGVDSSLVESRGFAAALMDRLIARSKSGLATVKQVHKLTGYGFVNVSSWTMKQASSVLDLIAGNGWMVPYGIDPATYNPEVVA